MSDAHPDYLSHQFDDVEQQRQASTLGIWLFLITEVMFFGGLFCGYTIYRWQHPEGWIVGSHLLNITLGATNTAVLLLSSLTMVLSVWAAQAGKSRKVQAFWIIATMVLGAVFLGIKVVEYQLGSDEWRARVKASKFAAWPAYGTARRGLIGLQDHGDRVAFRSIKIRVLP